MISPSSGGVDCVQVLLLFGLITSAVSMGDDTQRGDEPGGQDYEMTSSTECGESELTGEGEIMSPGYPMADPYPPDVGCMWDIYPGSGGTHVRLVFTHFDVGYHTPGLGCENGEVEVIFPSIGATYRYCGQIPPRTWELDVIRVRFSSGQGGQYSGFHATYSTIIGCGGRLGSGEGNFSSPGYPNPDLYPSMAICTWYIFSLDDPTQLMQLIFLDFDFGRENADCQKNYIQIFSPGEIKVCAYEEPPVTYATYIRVTFVTANSKDQRGFLASYSTISRSCEARQVTVNESIYTWEETKPGEVAHSQEICLSDGEPLAWCPCIQGDDTRGEWGQIEFYQHCEPEARSEVSDSLEQLTEMVVNVSNAEEVSESMVKLTSNVEILLPVDILYTSTTLEHVAAVPLLGEQVGKHILQTVNNLMSGNVAVVMEAQSINKTSNRILASLEAYSRTAELGDVNKTRLIQPLIALDLEDVSETTDTIGFGSLTGHPLLTSDSLVSYSQGSDLDTSQSECAIFLSGEVMQQASEAYTRWLEKVTHETEPARLKELMASRIRLNFMVFQTDVLFMSPEAHGPSAIYQRANSRIVAASILNVDIHTLQDPIQTIFLPRSHQPEATEDICGFWDMDAAGNHGNWSTEGCWFDSHEKGRVKCHCNHLTNFAILTDSQRRDIDDIHHTVLSIISIIGLTLSIIGLSITILTYILFPNLRRSKFHSQEVLVNLAVALLCTDIIFLVGIEKTDPHVGCLVVAGLLHYFLLVSFSWMLVESIVQYYRCVKIFGHDIMERFMLKTAIPCWGFPLLVVSFVALYDHELFKDRDYEFCWLSQPAFYYAFLIPVAIILLVNLIFFILVLKALFCREEAIRSNQSARKWLVLKATASISCFFLLGLSWVFGLLAIDSASLVFQYLFCLFTTPQGFLIFILFNLRIKVVREAWMTKLGGVKTKVSVELKSSRSDTKETSETGIDVTEAADGSKPIKSQSQMNQSTV